MQLAVTSREGSWPACFPRVKPQYKRLSGQRFGCLGSVIFIVESKSEFELREPIFLSLRGIVQLNSWLVNWPEFRGIDLKSDWLIDWLTVLMYNQWSPLYSLYSYFFLFTELMNKVFVEILYFSCRWTVKQASPQEAFDDAVHALQKLEGKVPIWLLFSSPYRYTALL